MNTHTLQSKQGGRRPTEQFWKLYRYTNIMPTSHISQTSHILSNSSCLLLEDINHTDEGMIHHSPDQSKRIYPEVCSKHSQTQINLLHFKNMRQTEHWWTQPHIRVWRVQTLKPNRNTHLSRTRSTAGCASTFSGYYRQVFVLVKQHQACDSLRSSEDRRCSSRRVEQLQLRI